ncbi:MAG: hypothetical protein ACT4P7_10800 [Gemmatimonadaceae bacterium]
MSRRTSPLSIGSRAVRPSARYAGAAAGTAISSGVGDADTVLPAGTRMTLRTTQVVTDVKKRSGGPVVGSRLIAYDAHGYKKNLLVF